MQNQLYPSEVIANSTEMYLWKVSVRSQAIYVSLIVAIFLTLFSLPFIFVDVVVRTSGIVRPVADKNELKPLVAGTIAAVMVKENQFVDSGQVLLNLQTDGLDTRLKLNQSMQGQKNSYIDDLSKLVALDTASLFIVSGLHSPLYKQQYTQFVQEVSQLNNSWSKKKREFAGTEYLYQEKLVPRMEYENMEHELHTAGSSYLAAIEEQLSLWQADRMSHIFSLTELQAEQKELLQKKRLYTIRAPIAGTLQQFKGRYVGGYLQSGETIGVISPNTELIVECFVSPKDIGQIRRGMPATFQIDAFDYNEWGLISGKVTDIAHDVIIVNDVPAFKIICKLDKTYLNLKSGHQGDIIKGMTLQARFFLARRSLFQLLFDKADDWMNPLQANL